MAQHEQNGEKRFRPPEEARENEETARRLKRIQIFAMLSLALIYIRTKSGIRLNKWVFYLFYPAHLIAIMLLMRFAV